MNELFASPYSVVEIYALGVMGVSLVGMFLCCLAPHILEGKASPAPEKEKEKENGSLRS